MKWHGNLWVESCDKIHPCSHICITRSNNLLKQQINSHWLWLEMEMEAWVPNQKDDGGCLVEEDKSIILLIQ